MKLPRRALTDKDLKHYAKKLKIKNFRGVFMKDTLPRKIRRHECGIINMDSDSGSGTHWTAYLKRSNEVVYFDSYGNLPPPIEVIKYFRSDGSYTNISFNYDVIQNFNSYRCGHFCLKFLYNYCK